MAQLPVVEIFSDYTWPWCYFITGRIERLQEEYEISARWTAYPLRPDTPEDGLPLEQLFPDKDIDKINVRLKLAAGQAGLPFGCRKMTFNSRVAHELNKWADTQGCGAAFRKAVFCAYLVDGKNIGKVPVLMELVSSIGLSCQEADRILETHAFKDAVDSDWARSLQVDPEYIPSLMLNGQLLVNPQEYSLYEKLMRDNNIKRRGDGAWNMPLISHQKHSYGVSLEWHSGYSSQIFPALEIFITPISSCK